LTFTYKIIPELTELPQLPSSKITVFLLFVLSPFFAFTLAKHGNFKLWGEIEVVVLAVVVVVLQ